ncbi:hypothetical protein NFI96_030983 [Prochilodus magdalenae]|nr:hypothetical protein NFI96_030983 [Prochilodus magdalenae]
MLDVLTLPASLPVFTFDTYRSNVQKNGGEGHKKPKNPFLLPTDVEIFKKREADAINNQQDYSIFVDNVNSVNINNILLVSPQYSLSVKRETINKLQNEIETERHRIHLQETELHEGAIAFEKCIKENDQNSVEAVILCYIKRLHNSRAEKETRATMEKTAEIKKVTAQMMAIKSEIAKYQETLRKYQTCEKFLLVVAPAQWREEQNQKREKKREAKMKKRIKEMEVNSNILSSSIKGTEECIPVKATQAKQLSRCSRKQSVIQERRSSTSAAANEEQELDSSDSEEQEPALYFSDPKEMLSVLTELEEQNLFYIQNLQETEEAMDEIQKTVQQTQDKMNREIHFLKQQIEIMQATIQREQEKVSELELTSRIFSYGEYRADNQDHMLKLLHKKVKEVYTACLGELDCNISTLHMLANIENKVVDVLDQLETMPPEKVDFVRSLRNKEKRAKMREEKAQLKKQHQEERLKLAMERATSDSKKRMGKKLMPRSEPLERKKKNKVHLMTTKGQQDHLHFFT